MHALLQRVTEAAVSIDGECVAAIGAGLLIFVGVFPTDTTAIAERLADRAVDLRIFADSNKLMNRSVLDIAGQVLVVSQFTLAADTSSGRRPSFASAAPPAQAQALYDDFVERIRVRMGKVDVGQFGADMQVSLVNDGPVTFLLS